MTDSLLASLGLYGATLVVAFVAGMFPLLSIEVFLGVLTTQGLEARTLVVLIGVAAVGHQLAKTLTYYVGAGVFELPRGKLRERIAAAKARIDRWNRRPRFIMFLSATLGFPPLVLLGYIAHPLMKMGISTFTAISLTGRILRYSTLVAVARLF